MAPPVGIVTGGSSGIGWALVQHLVSMGWNVVIADVHPPKESIPNNKTLYVRTDVSSWEQQADMFKQAYAWGKRLDFCALNAGIDDRDDIFNSLSYDVDKPPKQPNTRTFSVNLTGTYYGIKLAAHYMTIPSKHGGKAKLGGKIIVTSSGTGLFPTPGIPQYSATKHALVGLVRALGRSKAALEANVRINAVCPAIVATGALPPGLLDVIPPNQITPMSTILRCFDALGDFGDVGHDDWVEQGRMGETVEGNVQDLIWHHPPVRPQGQGGSFAREKGALAVAQVYKERNRQFAIAGE
ncbi:hypothetical protein H2200_005074 [Cladophialophora chaetospira]|uniref:NAD(P)-binding protein n=1 Tax=Cladophialophora chaetospira TaxID=386627 RepID=A0AA38XBI4_9EURO|nr:hypothetical protein H2200_005074 [Cladophialophora chaetospira]